MEPYSYSRGPRPCLAESRLRFLAPLAAMAVLGCSSIINHVVQPHLGPCAGAMDSVRNARGAPAKKEYNETEDLDTKQQQVEHVWYYTAPAESSAAVYFSWNPVGSDCGVTEKRSNARSPSSFNGSLATRTVTAL
jgi:hypothetical protein